MYRIIIAEDEDIIRRGIRNAVNWGEIGCQVEAEALNGQQAVELVEKLRPDILISDIRMPVRDGIYVAKKVWEQDICCKIIFLTGYDYFAYAQNALRYGVSDFLLKPVSGSELKGSVLSAIEKICKERATQTEHQYLQENLSGMRCNFIRQSAFHGQEDGAELKRQLALMEMDSSYYRIGVARLENYAQVIGEPPLRDRRFLKEYLREELTDRLSHSCRIYLVDYHTDSFILMLCFDSFLPVMEGLSSGAEAVRSAYGWKLAVGCSSFYSDFAMTRIKFREAETALESRFYTGDQSVLEFDKEQMPHEEAPQEDKDKELYGTELKRMVLDGEEDPSIEDCLKNYGLALEAVYQNDLQGIGEIKNLFIMGYLKLSMEMRNRGISYGSEDQDAEVCEEMYGTATLGELIQLLGDRCHEMAALSRKKAESAGKGTIADIKHYLQEHYAEQVSLKDVAEHVYMNPSYVSRIVKKETGRNLLELLREIRIGKAMGLMEETRLKTYEIAEITGFSDPKYFSLQFKKVTGYSPSEYRQRLAQGKE